jgi:hypothetical protein
MGTMHTAPCHANGLAGTSASDPYLVDWAPVANAVDRCLHRFGLSRAPHTVFTSFISLPKCNVQAPSLIDNQARSSLCCQLCFPYRLHC